MVKEYQNETHISGLPTEQRNPKSQGITSMTPIEILQKINEFDGTVAGAVREVLPEVDRAVELVVERMRRGGRLIYAGAGTSGRLGYMDAAECSPTYGVSNVLCIMAGGRDAVFTPRETLEDEKESAARDLKSVELKSQDIVFAAAASGRTPYCIGALEYAREVGAGRVSLSCNQHAAMSSYAEVAIEVNTGPEFIMGSTRMKAGTAQKMVMNMISTTAMIQLGHTYDNLMIKLRCSNQKGKNRAVRLVCEAIGRHDPQYARQILDEANGDVCVATLMELSGANRETVNESLVRHGNSFKETLEELNKIYSPWFREIFEGDKQ
ncbi:N-acetylmuramic acid 6-phosphate etherase [Spirochaetia bacterium]|nr:N-acetylmuramic acid 6-phosphate etherase [Spirochaetia bacterium]